MSAQLAELLRSAGRAPSAHNTQPWTVTPSGALGYALSWDVERELPVGDPTRRDLFLALGAFTEAFLIASAALEVPLRVEWGAAPERGAVARFVRADECYPTPFTAADLAGRRSARGAYAPGTLPDALLAEATRAFAGSAGLWRGGTRALAPLLDEADRRLFGDPALVAELRRWLRLRPMPAGHPHARDGLTGRALALSRIEERALHAVLRPAAYRVLRRVGLARGLAAASRGLLRYDGSVLVVTAPSGPVRPVDLLESGRGLLRCWLTLARDGYATHPLSQVIDCARTAGELEGTVGATALAVFRVGRPVAEPVRSARWTD
ncbi:hypothetical protein [Embleya scabrispora]|uniref:hypothetical protein n=1 Tax=Embleya scabrispora TaxID=159449 RepID=UPI0003663C82|nr:hypothetical protein [Embleya scabrispora]